MSKVLEISAELQAALAGPKTFERPKPLAATEFQAKVAEYQTLPIPITTDSMHAYIERAKADWATPIEESA